MKITFMILNIQIVILPPLQISSIKETYKIEMNKLNILLPDFNINITAK